MSNRKKDDDDGAGGRSAPSPRGRPSPPSSPSTSTTADDFADDGRASRPRSSAPSSSSKSPPSSSRSSLPTSSPAKMTGVAMHDHPLAATMTRESSPSGSSPPPSFPFACPPSSAAAESSSIVRPGSSSSPPPPMGPSSLPPESLSSLVSAAAKAGLDGGSFGTCGGGGGGGGRKRGAVGRRRVGAEEEDDEDVASNVCAAAAVGGGVVGNGGGTVGTGTRRGGGNVVVVGGVGAGLDSLPKRRVEKFPSECDRKRILGCLAALLASSFDYDTVDERELERIRRQSSIDVDVDTYAREKGDGGDKVVGPAASESNGIGAPPQPSDDGGAAITEPGGLEPVAEDDDDDDESSPSEDDCDLDGSGGGAEALAAAFRSFDDEWDANLSDGEFDGSRHRGGISDGDGDDSHRGAAALRRTLSEMSVANGHTRSVAKEEEAPPTPSPLAAAVGGDGDGAASDGVDRGPDEGGTPKDRDDDDDDGDSRSAVRRRDGPPNRSAGPDAPPPPTRAERRRHRDAKAEAERRRAAAAAANATKRKEATTATRDRPRQRQSPRPPRRRKRTRAEAASLALDRHRRRRHAVHSDLLLSSADLLLLGDGHARAFLPMLGRLLVPAARKGGGRSERGKGDDDGGGDGNGVGKSPTSGISTTGGEEKAARKSPPPASPSAVGPKADDGASEAEVRDIPMRTTPAAAAATTMASPMPPRTLFAVSGMGSSSDGPPNESMAQEDHPATIRNAVVPPEDNDKGALVATVATAGSGAHEEGSGEGRDAAKEEERDKDWHPRSATRMESLPRLSPKGRCDRLATGEAGDEEGGAGFVGDGGSDGGGSTSEGISAAPLTMPDEEPGGNGDLDNEPQMRRANTPAPKPPVATSSSSSAPDEFDSVEMMKPFLQSMTPGSGFQCVSLLLLQHLLRSETGYDARIRQAFKRLAVVVFVHEMKTYGHDDDDDDEAAARAGGVGDGSGWPAATAGGGDNAADTGNAPTTSEEVLTLKATRKFEALEHGVALKLINLSAAQRAAAAESQRRGGAGPSPPAPTADGGGRRSDLKGQIVRKRPTISRDQIVRGLKIGSAGVVAGTLFALTGGLAAPGIAAGVAAVAGSTAAATAAVVTLTSTAAVTAIFGVGGGSLAAYKMQRRTRGLTEFDFQKETGGATSARNNKGGPSQRREAELFSTICLSGWLRDKYDFQRPWGVTPTNPRLVDRLQLLERFYYVNKREHVSKCARILSNWKGEERELWRLLREKYGRDPDSTIPLDDGPRYRAVLTHEENEVVDNLLDELGYASSATSPIAKPSPTETMREGWRHRFRRGAAARTPPRPSYHQQQRRQRAGSSLGDARESTQSMVLDSMHGPSSSASFSARGNFSGPSHPDSHPSPSSLRGFRRCASLPSNTNDGPASPSPSAAATTTTALAVSNGDAAASSSSGSGNLPKHLKACWDYRSTYGGELYTVRWESRLLLELCDSVTDMAVDMVGGVSKEILKQTALATLITAIALPYALVSVANSIDGTWTLAIERCDEAGVELAKSLLYSQAGHRPVTLLGFSMGARTIYSCLKELARHQELWEDHQERKKKRELLRRRREAGETTSDLGDDGSDECNDTEDEDESKYAREPASIVEDAILMGTPNHLSLVSWEACRQIVAGRLVNCYSKKDYILAIMFQVKRFTGIIRPVCGTTEVNVPGVENYDVTNLVSSHADYCLAVGDILKTVRHGQPKPHTAAPRKLSSEEGDNDEEFCEPPRCDDPSESRRKPSPPPTVKIVPLGHEVLD